MIISKTPFRISFFGGGTDYPVWYREHGGSVLAVTVNRYCYLTCRHLPPFFDHRFRVVWSRIENCQTVDEIAHPAVREVLRYLGVERGLEIHYDGDLPARSGIGSSSAFTVGLLNAIHALRGEMVSRRRLAEEGIHVEQERLREVVGSQDQVMAAYGGLNQVTFHRDGEITVAPLPLRRERMEELEGSLMLFYTGIKRTASQVADSYVRDLELKVAQLERIRALVDEGVGILSGATPIGEFGGLLDELWRMKRELGARVSNERIDGIYAAARAAGALGGKITGAGGGGFMLLFVPPERRAAVRAALSGLVHVPFGFERQGSQIIYCEPDEDPEAAEEYARAGITAMTSKPTEVRVAARMVRARGEAE